MIYLYNSYSQKIEEFKTLKPKTVTMYVCGITPYDTTHIGHAFTYVIFDVFKRYLTSQGYNVEYTQNVTDIDDDIVKRAKEEKKNWKELGNFWTKKFLSDLDALHVQKPTHYVKATDYIPTIIEFVSALIRSKNAYEKDGNVYFDVSTFPQYGDLSHFSHHQMIQLSRERGANPDDPNKKNPLDFILWSSVANANSAQNNPAWDSPFGSGRPGWHIECSSMIYKTLGKQIDVHGGGRDLIFPHHESEIAQSESFTQKSPFVSYWMHTAMVLYQGEKMSKSLGNLVMISELLKTYSPFAIKLYLLSHHYRKTWEFSEEELSAYQTLWNNLEPLIPHISTTNASLPEEFTSSLDNDFDTSAAVDFFQKEARAIIHEKSLPSSRDSSFLKMCEVFGLL